MVLRGLVASAELVARNPAVAGGTTAFLVSLFFVSANALWYQPHFHNGAFFATRGAAPAAVSPPVPTPSPAREPVPDPISSGSLQPDVEETTGAVPQRQATVSEPAGDPGVWKVQSALATLGLYKGTVDGLTGPQTQAAIDSYRRIVGMEAGGGIDGPLLDHLGIGRQDADAAVPPPAPRPMEARPEEPQQVASAAAAALSDAMVMKIQAGLKAFGNDGIKVDGSVGADTRAALREFQSLFGLPVTGEPDASVLAKMKNIGLTN